MKLRNVRPLVPLGKAHIRWLLPLIKHLLELLEDSFLCHIRLALSGRISFHDSLVLLHRVVLLVLPLRTQVVL